MLSLPVLSCLMKQALLIVDIQPSFSPPQWLIERVQSLSDKFPSVATVERHDENKVPFRKQLNWSPGVSDNSLVSADHICIKYGYSPTESTLDKLRASRPDRVLVCGIQADTCVLAAGFKLFDAGLSPTLIADCVIGSSLDPSGDLGIRLWRHHFGQVVESYKSL